MTIIEAIKIAMRDKGSPMTYKEAYNAIVEKSLYNFHSADPASIVLAQIRRSCAGLDFPSASSTKHFRMVEEGKFWPLERIEKGRRRAEKHKKALPKAPVSVLKRIENELNGLAIKYREQLTRQLLDELRKLSPAGFELFAKRLLEVYGFHKTEVTQISKDGGIDGFGQLNVGLASLRVAFQCKRWTKSNIQRPEIDQFRGAIQGRYDQGVFFTTSSFSSGAIGDSIRLGAVPIVLVDGHAIVSMMMEKAFGIEKKTIEIPTYALDIIFAEATASNN
ncbi:MAG: restriction endonuclease [Rhodocyclaceae bacterium]|nr:restriction endonuclease [Rhodocyclaceae bacterium]